MPHTCPHDRCTFFIRESVSQCLGCGRSARSPRTGLIRGDGQGVVLTTAALLGLLLGLLPMLWLAQSSWLVGLVVAAIAGVVGWVVLRNQRATSTFTSVDSGYRRAVDECTLWLGTWSELFTLAADANHMPEDERLLLVEAQAAAADAAAEAASRRNDYAKRFIANGFDRLDFLAVTRPLGRSTGWETEWRQAIATIEYYLETLWIDHHAADQARTRIDEFRLTHRGPAQRRSQLVQRTRTVKLFDPAPDFDRGSVRSSEVINLADGVDAERFRLRAERSLLRDAPLTTAEFTAQAPDS